MTGPLYQKIVENKAAGKKMLAVLVDPDNVTVDQAILLGKKLSSSHVDFVFVGGSLMVNGDLTEVINALKVSCNLPVVIFPGSNLHISDSADAILLLSLISGRNPDLLIGQHVAAAPILKKSSLEILSTGYMLIDSGKPTTVSYISNTTPIPQDKPEIAACTAMAGELLGHSLIYLDGGSGAKIPVPAMAIKSVSNSVDIPVIVGGGIRDVSAASDAFASGADVLVVGNYIESNPEFLVELSGLLEFGH